MRQFANVQEPMQRQGFADPTKGGYINTYGR